MGLGGRSCGTAGPAAGAGGGADEMDKGSFQTFSDYNTVQNVFLL